MKIAATSDLHGHLPCIPECDLLLIAGDICPFINHDVDYQAQYLDQPFRHWLENLPAKRIIGVAGNHDFIFERAPDLVPADLPWTYLQDQSVIVDGLTFYGTPWQREFCNWAFNLPEDELASRWQQIPDDLDILLCHGPPFGYGDLTGDGTRCGSPSLINRIYQVSPRLAVYGHIHEDGGNWPLQTAKRVTQLANVSHLDRYGKPTRQPIQFEL